MPDRIHYYLILFITLSICSICNAQYFQNNKWYFGSGAGVDFNSGTPVSIPGLSLNTSEGSASVADRLSGNLLFYTNGITICNSLNLPMPNGTGLLGGTPGLTSSTTAARIVPRPGSSTQYYVFTVDEFGGPGGLRLNLVDMTLNGGLGDVVAGFKNILIASNVAEKLEYAPHPNGTDYWLVAKELVGNQYMTWQVTSAGVSATPVISLAGTSSSNGAGYLKFNSTYTQLANANVFGSVDLLSFNSATGQITNIINLPVPIGSSVYGVEFSPSGRFLYVSNLLDGLFQFDLNATNIPGSIQSIAPVFAAALQLGPDCRIYVADGGLSVIPNPDLPAPACGFNPSAVNIQPGGSSYGLPMKVIYTDDIKPQITSTPTAPCAGNAVTFNLTGLNLFPQSIQWDFGDPASGASNTASASFGSSVSHIYTGTGQYLVRAIYSVDCKADTVTDTITIVTCGTLQETCLSFQYTGALQQWTVPSGVDTIRVKMWGGAGGGGPDQVNNAGGGGGFTQAIIPVTAGQILDIYVGGGGGAAIQNSAGAGAWPNGGAGGVGNRNIVSLGDVGGAGGGGGRSQIDIGGVIYAIAGAGGGAALNRNGGGGGGLVAEFTVANNQFNLNGFGGTQTAGGAPSGNTICPNPVSGTAGSFLQGGNGASDTGGTLNDRTGGGGGGDGYYGGGGGGSHDGCFGVGSTGGGGSGYICTTCPGVTGSTQTAGVAGIPANSADPLLSSFPGTATGENNSIGGNGLVYICYDSVACISTNSGFSTTACGSYIAPNGTLLTSSGTYLITIPNTAGCDSIISISLTINSTFLQPPISISACSSYTAPWGTTYTQSGTYSDTLSTVNGCDSIVSVNLSITGTIITPPLSANACSSYTAPWGTTYTQSGTYSDTLSTVNGCDSIVSVNLSITGTIITPPLSASACSSYTAPWGTTYTQSGTYSDTLSTVNGCDSIVSVNLSITGTIITPPLSASACSSYTAPWGTTYTQSGTYSDTLSTVNGCDSIVSVNLSITGTIIAPALSASACSSYTAPWGTTYTQSGTYSDTLSTVNGCDSIVSVNLSITGTIITPALSASACSSYTAPWGTTYTQSGTYSDTLSTVNGCDSIVGVNLNISGTPALSSTATPDSCSEGTGTASVNASAGTAPYNFTWSNGATGSIQTNLNSGNYTVTVTDQNGCTASVLLSIPLIAPPVISLSSSSLSIIEGDSVQLNASGASTYLWSPAEGLSCTNCPNPVAIPLQATTYTVTGTDLNGCTDKATISIFVDIRCNELFVPSIFSPNSSGPAANEQVCVFSNCIDKMDFAIYDRWGQLVYESSDPKQCWDGKKNGKEISTGVYTYRLMVKQINGIERNKSGNITLIR